MMRIITGSARGVRLKTLEGKDTRPTAERVKEAIFSSLQSEIEGRRVLDLFGGSGQMGLEALSRGATHAVLLDASRDAVSVIRENLVRTRLGERATVLCTDALAYLRAFSAEPFHLVFLDPPYAAGLIPSCLAALLARGTLAAGAFVVCETADAGDVFGGDEALAARFSVLREQRYGAAYVTVLTPKGEGTV